MRLLSVALNLKTIAAVCRIFDYLISSSMDFLAARRPCHLNTTLDLRQPFRRLIRANPREP